MKEQFVKELKEKGLTNEKQNKDFSFEMVDELIVTSQGCGAYIPP